MRAFVAYAIPYNRPMEETIQDVKKIRMWGIVGLNKTTSSLVMFLNSPGSFHIQNGHPGRSGDASYLKRYMVLIEAGGYLEVKLVNLGHFTVFITSVAYRCT